MRAVRLRRLREAKLIRDWVGETILHPQEMISPYFVVEGKKIRKEINSMPGVYHLSLDNLIRDIDAARGISSVLLFGLPEAKDSTGSEAYREDGIVQKAVRAIKKEYKDLIVITDVCLCAYTSHGHCGIIKPQAASYKLQAVRKILKPEAGSLKPDPVVDNDATLEVLAKVALSHAQAGADFVAPSAMMDGQVRAVRKALDEGGSAETKILAYSAKYASNFYGPFREALCSAPQFGDRKAYQMDYRNSNEALREIEEDIAEGADIVMIKPALAYLDVIYRAKEKFNLPLAAYNVSGEYAMVKKLAAGDKAKEKNLALEVLSAIKRAGANLIITYWAKDVAGWLR